jgi:pyruvate carboxylase
VTVFFFVGFGSLSLSQKGSLLKPVDFEAERKKLEEKYQKKISDEDLITHLIYPKVLTFRNQSLPFSSLHIFINRKLNTNT